jgi:transposase
MFIRQTKTKNRKTNSTYIKHQLVESYRTEKGPRQRVIMELGSLSLPKSMWPQLASVLEARLAGQELLLIQDPQVTQIADEVMGRFCFSQIKAQEKQDRHEKREMVNVDMQSVSTTEHRSLGPELVAHSTWESLQIDHILGDCGFSKKEQALAKAVVIARLISPSSDLSSWNWLRNQTALLELLPADLSNIGKDAIYEIADMLLEHKDRLESFLRNRESILFPSQTTLFLYDLTNTYFEGQCKNNELAKRGKSKENRTDSPLVTLAIVVDSRGLPIFSQIYKGNQSEPPTLEEILERLYVTDEPQLFQNERPTIVMDRGIATKDNIELLKDKKYPYLVIERRAVEKDYLDEFENAKETFECVDPSSKSVYIKKLPWENGCRVLCLSKGREQKERAINELKEERFLTDLGRLCSSVSKGNVKLIEKVGERIGRLKERYPSVSQYYEIHLDLDDKQKKVNTVRFNKKEKSSHKKSSLAGCYVIETSHQDLSASEIWRLYSTLTKVEDAFRCLKTDLGVRPVYHQLNNRTEAHLFISVLAYHLLICIEQKLSDHGDNRRWATIRKELSTHQRSTVIMTDEDDKIHHIRVSGMPEKSHKEIYHILGVKNSLKRHHRIVASRL